MNNYIMKYKLEDIDKPIYYPVSDNNKLLVLEDFYYTFKSKFIYRINSHLKSKTRIYRTNA